MTRQQTIKDLQFWMKYSQKKGIPAPQHVRELLDENKKRQAATNAMLRGEPLEVVKKIEKQQTPEAQAKELERKIEIEKYNKLQDKINSIYEDALQNLKKLDNLSREDVQRILKEHREKNNNE